MDMDMLKNLCNEADVKECYKEAEGVSLPIHIFFPEKSEETVPAVVCIHGGAWRAITTNAEWNGGTMLQQARYYAHKGVVGVAISYRDLPDPKDRNEASPKLRDLIEDCMDAVRYLRRNAERFGIDTERIAVIGDSAGGHLAASLGTIGNKEERLVDAVIACNPITDLHDEFWKEYIPYEKPEDVSPLCHIAENSVPMLVMHGTEDTVVDPRHSTAFFERMRELGNRCDIKLLDGSKHAFIIVGYTATDEQIQEAMEEADRFLISVGFLEK